jgi:hypothetical protein
VTFGLLPFFFDAIKSRLLVASTYWPTNTSNDHNDR